MPSTIAVPSGASGEAQFLAPAGHSTSDASALEPEPVAAEPGIFDASVTEVPPPSRATPTVPSPSADPPPEPSPVPPRAQASSSALGNGVGAGRNSRAESQRIQELLSELMSARKELTEKSTELRQVVSERNALRTRILQAENQATEIASAFRAEAQLRSQFVDAHAASSASLRARVTELEGELRDLPELELKLVDLEAKLAERDQQILDLTQASRTDSKPPSERAGLRRIRGIGPAYERALLALGITTVAQIARLSEDEITRIAPLIKARADRILRDDWVGQALRLADPEP